MGHGRKKNMNINNMASCSVHSSAPKAMYNMELSIRSYFHSVVAEYVPTQGEGLAHGKRRVLKDKLGWPGLASHHKGLQTVMHYRHLIEGVRRAKD